ERWNIHYSFSGAPHVASLRHHAKQHRNRRSKRQTPRRHSSMQPGAFEPEAIAAMSEAFESALKELQDTGHAAREVIAGRIISAARTGERDPARLREAALRKS